MPFKSGQSRYFEYCNFLGSFQEYFFNKQFYYPKYIDVVLNFDSFFQQAVKEETSFVNPSKTSSLQDPNVRSVASCP